MTPQAQRSAGPLSRRAGFIIGMTWVLIGVIGCAASAWLGAQSIAQPLRFAIVTLMVVVAYWAWFRVLRAVGAVKRGAFGTLSAVVDDIMPGR